MILSQPAREIIQASIDDVWAANTEEDMSAALFSRHVVYSLPKAEKTCQLFSGPKPPSLKSGCAMNIEDTAWPFKTEQFDRILITHGLELTQDPLEMMQEVWRVTAPEGRILLFIANRSGLWARNDNNLLGVGRPYSLNQACGLLKNCQFSIVRTRSILLTPPGLSDKVFEAASKVLEPLAPFCSILAGMHVIEAEKKVMGLPPGSKSPVHKDVEAAAWGKPALPRV